MSWTAGSSRTAHEAIEAAGGTAEFVVLPGHEHVIESVAVDEYFDALESLAGS